MLSALVLVRQVPVSDSQVLDLTLTPAFGPERV